MNDLTLYICYNDDCSEFPKQIQSKFPELTINAYNESHYAEKKKAYKIKGGYSARMTPFMLLLGPEKTYIQAFYSEDDKCNLKNLEKCLTSM